MNTRRTTARGLLAVCLFSLSLAACDSADPDPSAEIAPPVITPEAFDLSDALFPGANRGGEARLGGGDNFANAAIRVGAVTTIVGLNLLIPKAVTAAALNADPFVEEGTWIWSNTIRINQQDATFRLAGTPEGTSVDWSMQITATDPETGEVYDDFELYTAETALDGASGAWQLYYRIDDVRTRVLDADFDAESEDDKTLRFAVPAGVGDAGGDAVVYATNGDGRSFDWDQASEGNTHLIVWDAETGAGSITATNYNGGERACWNEGFEDVACN